MNHYAYGLLALDIARQRTLEAEQHYLETQLAATIQGRPSATRRLAANVVAAFSRGSARIVRRLDECVADELGRTLAPAE